MDIDKMFPGRFIKAGDFNGKPWTTPKIKTVNLEKLEGNKGAQIKGIVWFDGYEKGWVINRTNAECLRAMWGRDTDAWVGHRVTLHPIVWQGEELAIRVKGSPDLKESMSVEIKLPRKSAFTVRLEKIVTPQRQNGKPPAQSLTDAAEAHQNALEREPGEEG